MAKKYMSLAYCVEKWGVSAQEIEKLCYERKIWGVAKLGEAWIIPENAINPFVENKQSNRTIPKIDMQNTKIMPRKDGLPFGSVLECEIGGTTYRISGSSRRQCPLLKEMTMHIAQDIERETGIRLSIEFLEVLNLKAIQNSSMTETLNDCLSYFRRQLKSHDFSTEDIEVLLAKVVANCEQFL